jgi:hypothetical protein
MASPISTSAGTHTPTAPTLCSHFPTPSPRTLSVTTSASAASEKTT